MIRFITVRNFLRDFRKEIEDMPFVVTRYGKPAAVVISWEHYEEWTVGNLKPKEEKMPDYRTWEDLNAGS